MKMKNIISLFCTSIVLYSCNALKNLTWSDDIANIVYEKCSPCHHSTLNGNISLMNYEEVVKKKGMIKFALERHMMPPVDQDSLSIATFGEISLTEDEREKIILWIEASCPKGIGEVNPPRFQN